MKCDEWRSDLAAYVDGELPNESARRVEEHLSGCPDCKGEVLSLTQMKRLTRTAAMRYQPPAAFRLKIEKKVTKRKLPNLVAWLAPVLVAVALLVAVLVPMWWIRNARSEQLLSEITDLHVSTLASVNQVDVVSSDRHTVKPWFQGKLPFTFELPELAGSPYELLGGRLAYIEHSPAAHLLFGIRKHRISVFIFDESFGKGTSPSVSTVTRNANFNIEAWSQGGLRYVVIGDASPQDIQGLGQLLKSH